MTDQPHGTRARYQGDGCRCRPCCVANAAYAAEQRKQHEPGYVDAGPVAAHLADLRRRGMGVERIAMTSGVSDATIWRIVGGAPSVLRATAETLLEVPFRPSLGSIVSSVQAWRYVRLIQKDGYTLDAIKTAVGTPRLRFGRTRARARTVLRIIKFYRTHVEEPSNADADLV